MSAISPVLAQVGADSTNLSATDCENLSAEARRLEVLDSLRIMNTGPEDAYDRIVRRVSEFFDVPICLITLAGKEDLWFKAKTGVDISCVPRDTSFCEAALEHDGVLVIPDALLSPRFINHPLVVGPPNIRFYAGLPLVVDDQHKVGTLCIIDTRTRELDAAGIAALQDFAAMVVDELHLRLRTLRLEEQLAKQAASDKTALASQKARADFLAMVTHEVRAPLNAIAGMVELMCNRSHAAIDDLGVEALRLSTEHLVRMINEVLDLAKLEATGFTFNREPFDLRRKLLRALAVVRPLALEKNIELGFDCAAGVPAVVIGDRTRLAQIVLNLLTNAIKFTDQGSVNLTVSVAGGGSDDQYRTVLFCVSDTGIGMTSESAGALFRNFAQAAPDVRARYGGTGLGLAICQKLVEGMGGTINVRSELGVGTAFDVILPVECGQEPSAATETFGKANEIERADQLVLVADDDALCLKISKAMLSRLGYRVEAYANGRDALQALRTKAFDVAVLDLNMPDLDGYTIARDLRQQPGPGTLVPLIALTGSSKPEGDPRVVLFDDYILKPLSSATLDKAIMKILSRRQSIGLPKNTEGAL
jgi:signal transduction histidine kinase/ActR/RegA family two-component response regulator